MQVVYNNHDFLRVSGPSLAINISTVCVRLCQPSTRYTQMPLSHASVDMSLITHAAAKILKNATYFAYNGLHWEGGYRPVTYIF